ncbi:MAG: 16S rRNA (adenine(1518)-N(6)/adenine(1519)-N(6))-dimethyltransferase RsmA [Fidelibacterota bacterium]
MKDKTPYPKKSLGQNFLQDPNIIRKIVDAVQPRPDDIIVEIGPGRGAITSYLAGKCRELILIEFDQDLANTLQKEYETDRHVRIIRDDILKTDWKEFLPADKVVGNLPYNISSQILFALYSHAPDVGEAVFMVQKEFARRLVAEPSTKDYGIMTILTRLYGKAEILFHIPPTVFFPRPKVDSTLVKIRLDSGNNQDIDDKAYFHQLVRTAFNQRRKTLRNSLKKIAEDRSIPSVDLSLRAEALTFEDFKRLYHILKEDSPASV